VPAKLTKKMDIYREGGHCNLHNECDATTTQLKQIVFCPREQTSKKLHEGQLVLKTELLPATQIQNQISSSSQSAEKHWLENISVFIRLYRK
jgi:hypothetical protein